MSAIPVSAFAAPAAQQPVAHQRQQRPRHRLQHQQPREDGNESSGGRSSSEIQAAVNAAARLMARSESAGRAFRCRFPAHHIHELQMTHPRSGRRALVI